MPARRLSKTELQDLLTSLEEKLGGVRSLRTTFRQEKHLSIFADVVETEGVCLFQRPDRVRFEITRPFRSVLIARGKTVAKFEFLDRRWRKVEASPDVILTVTGQIATWLQGRFREKSDVYEISALAGESTTLILTPRHRSFRRYVTAIELGLTADRGHIATVTIREPGGDFTLMTFTSEDRDAVLPAGVFRTSGQAPMPLPPPRRPTSRPAPDPPAGRSALPPAEAVGRAGRRAGPTNRRGGLNPRRSATLTQAFGTGGPCASPLAAEPAGRGPGGVGRGSS